MRTRGLIASLHIRGRRMPLLALSTAFIIIALMFFIRALVKPDTGLVENYPEVVVRQGRVIFSPKEPFSPAVSAGLLPDRDEILSVNGTAIHGSLDVLHADADIRTFEPFSVEVLRDGSDTIAISVVPVFAMSRLDWIFSLVFVMALAYAAFAFSLKIPDEPHALPLILAALTYLIFTCVKPFYYESLATNLLVHLGKITSWLLVIFGLYFPSRRGTSMLRALILTCIPLIYAAFVVLRTRDYALWVSSGAEAWLDRFRFLGRIGNVSDGIAYVSLAVLLASAYLRSGSQPERRQLQWIIGGLLVALPPYFFFDQLPLILGSAQSGRVSLGSFAEMFLACIPIFLIVGLAGNRRIDLRFFLTRYSILVFVFLVMFAFFSVAYVPIRDAIASEYRIGPPLGDFLAAALIFIVLVPLRAAITKAVDGALFPDRARRAPSYVEGLERRNSDLAGALERIDRQHESLVYDRIFDELRTLMRGVSSRIDAPFRRISRALLALDRAELGPEIRRALDDAREPSVLVGDLVRALDSLSSASPMASAVTGPEMLLRSAIERVRREFPDVRYQLRIETIRMISCRPGELVGAFSLVLQNAAESQTGISEPLAVNAGDEDLGFFVEIGDRGPGITAHDARMLFRPFFSTKPGHQGLGLYLARLIASKNLGTLRILPRDGGGTLARFEFQTGRGMK
jgi:signal transduction histidine kinase